MERNCGRANGIRLAIVLALVIAFASPLAATAGAAADRSSCPNGMDLYDVPQTEAELRALPRINDGLNAVPAPYTVAELVALGNQIDANSDGTFCLKEVSNLRGQSVKAWGFFYGARDNDTSAS